MCGCAHAHLGVDVATQRIVDLEAGHRVGQRRVIAAQSARVLSEGDARIVLLRFVRGLQWVETLHQRGRLSAAEVEACQTRGQVAEDAIERLSRLDTLDLGCSSTRPMIRWLVEEWRRCAWRVRIVQRLWYGWTGGRAFEILTERQRELWSRHTPQRGTQADRPSSPAEYESVFVART